MRFWPSYKETCTNVWRIHATVLLSNSPRNSLRNSPHGRIIDALEMLQGSTGVSPHLARTIPWNLVSQHVFRKKTLTNMHIHAKLKMTKKHINYDVTHHFKAKNFATCFSENTNGWPKTPLPTLSWYKDISTCWDVGSMWCLWLKRPVVWMSQVHMIIEYVYN